MTAHPRPITPIGQLLLEQGCITPSMLEEALAIQQRSGDRIGRILATQGHIGVLRLHQVIAQHYALPFINLHDTPAEAALQQPAHVNDYIRLQAIPHHMKDGSTCIATCEPTEALHIWAQRHYGDAYHLAITSPYDIYHHIDRYFSAQLDSHSREHLWRLMPQQSARRVLTRGQKWQLIAFIAIFAALFYAFPLTTGLVLVTLLHVFYFFTILLKCQLFAIGMRKRTGTVLPDAEIRQARDDSQWPVYTLLIPLYDEAPTIPRLIAALDALDYPKSRLDIKLIVERGDTATIEAIKACKPHSGYELIYVPYSLPQTKPKACNYALHFARGRYVAIFDAEDEPDTLQLKKAVLWFSRQPDEVICLQARLNYYNREKNLLTRLFSIEYAAWFDFMLPGLRQLNIPIPLGGTSNHLDLQKLRELGEWDPYNVTEDADLGVRIALSGYKTDLLDSLTQEEAPRQLRIWMNQRTRWIRGYMQTWLVYMRHPLRLAKQLDFTAFWGFQFFIGGPCLTFLSAPLLWAVTLLWLYGIYPTEDSPLLTGMTGLAITNLLFGLFAHLLFACVIIRRYRWQGMLKTLCIFPLYWLLHSVASYRALWTLAFTPHKWEKTPHGEDDIATGFSPAPPKKNENA